VSSREERLDLLQAILAEYQKRSADLGEAVSEEMGAPPSLGSGVQVYLGLGHLNNAIDALKNYSFEEPRGAALILKEPIGVCGLITPWNWPINQIACKVYPALATGCTMVLKPSEVAPYSAQIFTEVMDAAGVPAGVYNLVYGDGAGVGAAISSHPDIDMVSFTGSTRAGKRVAELGAQTVKKVSLELGGKSANVILPDADLTKAVKVGVGNCYLNSGQTCTAWTRMLVHSSQYDEAVELAAKTASGYTVGDPFDEGTRLGPLVSKAQRDRVADYIEKGKAEGARVVAGGDTQPLEKGYFVTPTVFADVTTDMTIAQEEIFGPVLSILKYEDEDEALRIANDSIYGLAGGVWSADAEKAKAFARKMKTGQVDINGGSFNVAAPFGGFKQSGVGRELGPFGLEEFTQPKSLQL
jgi:aldehyde dehydrogenase (NAD+)